MKYGGNSSAASLNIGDLNPVEKYSNRVAVEYKERLNRRVRLDVER